MESSHDPSLSWLLVAGLALKPTPADRTDEQWFCLNGPSMLHKMHQMPIFLLHHHHHHRVVHHGALLIPPLIAWLSLIRLSPFTWRDDDNFANDNRILLYLLVPDARITTAQVQNGADVSRSAAKSQYYASAQVYHGKQPRVRTKSNGTLQHKFNVSTAASEDETQLWGEHCSMSLWRRCRTEGQQTRHTRRGKGEQNKLSAALNHMRNGKGRWHGEMWRGKGGCKIIIKRVDTRSTRKGVTHCCIADDSQMVSGNMCTTHCSRTVIVTLLPFFHSHFIFIAIFLCCPAASSTIQNRDTV